MATGTDYITDAFAEAGILAAEQPIEPTYVARALRVMNDLYSEIDISGTQLGFTPLAAESDTVRLPREYKRAFVMILAGALCSVFRRPITPELAANIKAANKSLLRISVKFGAIIKPSTLPVGSGNAINIYGNGVYGARYFAEEDEDNF